MKDQTRNLNPHKPARVAMCMWGSEYVKHGGGSMDFWDSLSLGRRNLCREIVREILNSRDEENSELVKAEL